MTRLINSVAILKLFLIAYHPLMRPEVLLAYANLSAISLPKAKQPQSYFID